MRIYIKYIFQKHVRLLDYAYLCGLDGFLRLVFRLDKYEKMLDGGENMELRPYQQELIKKQQPERQSRQNRNLG